MRAKYLLVTGVALVGSSLLYGNQVYWSVQDNKNINRSSVQTQNQNTNQGKPPVSGGGTSHGGGSGPRHRAATITEDAAKVIDEIMSVRDKSIPVELLAEAEAIAIFPSSGLGRQGVVSKRIKGGWGPPVFFNLREAGLGADYVLLIMNDDSLNSLLAEKFELGSEVNIAAGPVGRWHPASTDPRIDAGILSYSRSKGHFIGSLNAVKGSVISPDNDLNQAIYRLKATDLLTLSPSGHGKLPAELRILPETLTRYSRR